MFNLFALRNLVSLVVTSMTASYISRKENFGIIVNLMSLTLHMQLATNFHEQSKKGHGCLLFSACCNDLSLTTLMQM